MEAEWDEETWKEKPKEVSECKISPSVAFVVYKHVKFLFLSIFVVLCHNFLSLYFKPIGGVCQTCFCMINIDR